MTLIFGTCHHSLAVVARDKYESDSKDVSRDSEKSKFYLAENFTNAALVTGVLDIKYAASRADELHRFSNKTGLPGGHCWKY